MNQGENTTGAMTIGKFLGKNHLQLRFAQMGDRVRAWIGGGYSAENADGLYFDVAGEGADRIEAIADLCRAASGRALRRPGEHECSVDLDSEPIQIPQLSRGWMTGWRIPVERAA